MKKIPQGRSAYVSLIVLVALLGARTSAADTLTVTWDFNSEPEVEGYRVYVGTESGVYSQIVDVHNTNSYVFPSAAPGQRYCFAVLAYSATVASPLSQEVCGLSNEYPTLSSPGGQTGRVGVGVSLQLSANDPDGTPLAYSASGLPTGLTISPSSGTITGTPTAAGTFSVTARASDGVLTAQQSLTWVIQPPLQNVAPTLVNPGNQTGDVGRQVLLQLQGTDANGDVLTYSASELPAGLQLSSVTGLISGTPVTAASYNVTARVSDGRTTVSQSFGWTIGSASNTAPAPTAPDSADGTSSAGLARALGRKSASTEAKYKGSAAVRSAEETVLAPTRSLTGTQANTRPSASQPAHDQASNLERDYTGSSATSRQQPASTSSLTSSRTVSTRAIVSEAITAAPASEDGANLDVSRVFTRPATSMTDTPPRAAVTAPATAPRVTIDTPINRESFPGDGEVIFMGTARDALDVNLTDSIVWTSSRDGHIGTGGLLHKTLTPGTHRITASVTDSRGTTRSAQVTIVVSK